MGISGYLAVPWRQGANDEPLAAKQAGGAFAVHPLQGKLTVFLSVTNQVLPSPLYFRIPLSGVYCLQGLLAFY